MILPVRHGREPAILKLAWPHAVNAEELMGLRVWDGNGTVRLLASAPAHSALLLERLDHSRPLTTMPLVERARVAGRLIRELAIPAPDEIPALTDHAASMTTGMPDMWESTGRPFAESLRRRAVEIASEIGPQSARLLANWDLHPDNILAGERQPWLVIDPRAIVGDPEIGIWPMLLRCVDEMHDPGEMRAFVDAIVDAGNLDRYLAWVWTRVRAVDYRLWGLGHGFTEDPRRCEHILAWMDA